MKKPKAILFDVDGVLAVPQRQFLRRYNELYPERDVSEDDVQAFFMGDFQDALVNKVDLKELLEQHRFRWKWEGSVDELMDIWFEADSGVNTPALDLVDQIRARGIRCYLATNQEKYRTQYLHNVMFAGRIDGVYSSAQLGVKKPDQTYYQMILNDLELQVEDVLFVDDHKPNIDSAQAMGMDARFVDSESVLDVLMEVLA